MATEEFDVLVIGGGVVGAGTALDAVSRGLSVAVVEAADWAAGTSSKSSKLIHGGLRYLEQRDFRLVAEALRERALLLNRLAPHLVHPVPFLIPLTHRAWERVYIGAGVTLYDAMGAVHRRSGAVPRHRHLTRRAALTAAPAGIAINQVMPSGSTKSPKLAWARCREHTGGDRVEEFAGVRVPGRSDDFVHGAGLHDDTIAQHWDAVAAAVSHLDPYRLPGPPPPGKQPAVPSDVVRLPHRLRQPGLWGMEPGIFIADLARQYADFPLLTADASVIAAAERLGATHGFRAVVRPCRSRCRSVGCGRAGP